MSDYAARIVLPSLVNYARKAAPGFDFAISQASREMMLAQLEDGELDLALGIFPDAEVRSKKKTYSRAVHLSGRQGFFTGRKRFNSGGMA
ncbi:hypothetical protein ERHA55_53490 (plasmid) [Erwinia rhapontici]|nr:hypothetical protein ERHA55_53490 [Erwinia rhapontici]